MAITTTEILEDSEQADSSRHVGVKFISYTGKEVIRRFWANESFDTDKDVAAMIPDIETYMAKEEAQEVVGLIMQGKPMPTLNFTTAEQVKVLAVEQESLKTAEITKLTDEKTYLSEVK